MASSVLTYDGQVVTDQDVGDGRLLADIGQEVEYLRLNRDIQWRPIRRARAGAVHVRRLSRRGRG
jgi:hypothetical protein